MTVSPRKQWMAGHDMIELKRVDRDSGCREILEKNNTEAIPECERNSLDDLMDTGADVLGIFLEGVPVGYFVLREYKSIVYLAYFAVSRERRSEGIGSEALKQLIREAKGRRVVVEYEAPSGGDPDGMAVRRRDFYRRNGFHSTGWYTFYDETEFEIACTSIPFDTGEFCEFVEHLSTLVSDHIPKPYRKG